MKKRFVLSLVVVCLLFGSTGKLFSQEAYIGDIKLTAITFAQDGWLECNGQMLSISSYTALYSLLGTTYGGNGTTTFALPDLRGRVPIHVGQGASLSNYTLGQTGGVESVALTTSQMPAHTHGVAVSTDKGTTASPSGTYLANTGSFDNEYAASSTETNPAMVQPSGSGSAHENRQPYLTVRYVICVEGLYPTRP